MTEYCEEFTQFRVEQRKVYWRTTGERVAKEITNVARARHRAVDDIVFIPDSDCFNALIDQYFAEIRRFKHTHNFPAGQQANESKRAALTIKVLWNASPEELFVIPTAMAGSVYAALVVPFFSYQLACGHISAENIPEDIENLAMHCLTKKLGISDEWLIFSMLSFQRAYHR